MTGYELERIENRPHPHPSASTFPFPAPPVVSWSVELNASLVRARLEEER